MTNEDRQKPRYMAPGHFRALVAGAIVLALLIVGQDFLIPLAIAILLWNLLNALVEVILRPFSGRRTPPRWLAMALAIGLVIAVQIVLVMILSSQAGLIAEVGPRYVERLEALAARGIAFMGPDVSAAVAEALRGIDVTGAISTAIGSAGSFLSSMVLVALYVAFMLAEQHNIPNKLTAMFPNRSEEEDVRVLFAAISSRVRLYIWNKTLVSLLTGVASYVVLRLIGVDFAETWAIVIFLLNFIPNIGSVLGVVFPALLALVQFDTLTPFLIVVFGLGFIQFFIGNVLEPAFMGSSLNLSSFVIILALTFWGMIWGLTGMVLSVPITVMAMIVCSNVPNWRWIAVVLSKDGRIVVAERPAEKT